MDPTQERGEMSLLSGGMVQELLGHLCVGEYKLLYCWSTHCVKLNTLQTFGTDCKQLLIKLAVGPSQ